MGCFERNSATRVFEPVKFSAVDYAAADGDSVTVHILRGGVGDDVGAPLDGAAVYRGGEGVVDYKGNAVTVGGAGKFLDVEHRESGIRYRLAEYRLGVRPEGGV